MANPSTIRNGLATQLKTISALKRVYTRWPNIIDVPCAIIKRGQAEPEQTFGRGDLTMWPFEIYVFVSGAGGFENAQDNADPFAATSSTGGIYGAINADRTLGGVVASTFIKQIREDTDWQVGDGIDFYGFVAEVECWST